MSTSPENQSLPSEMFSKPPSIYQDLGFAFITFNGALFSKTLTAPFTRIQLIYQTFPELIKTSTLDIPYTGIYNCYKTILRQEGGMTLYRGNLADILKHLPSQYLPLLINDTLQSNIHPTKNDNLLSLLMKSVLVGGLSGSFVNSFTYSLDFVRVRLAIDILHVRNEEIVCKFTGILDCYKQIIRLDGISGLYRGFFVCCLSEFVYRGFYLGLFETIKNENDKMIEKFGKGYMSAMTGFLLSYPLSTIQRRMLMRSGEEYKYRNGIECMKNIIKEEGIFKLWRGVSLGVFVSVGGAAALMCYDFLVYQYANMRLAK